MNISKCFLLTGLLFFILSVFQAQITCGKIEFERKTNLYKKFKSEPDVQEWIKEADKSKVDIFELYFNDSISLFKPQESELKENLWWATSKNTVCQNYKSKSRLTIKEIWGEHVYVSDTLYTRKWKITDKHRTICGYNCRKAVWQANDSVRLYAWYCNEIMVSTGPESFFGLPGAILGIATEDGGVIYFAKSVEVKKPEPALLSLPKSKSKIYTSAELRASLEKDYGKQKWGKAMIRNLFGIW
ncbi:MAG: GLPGLI family protein [Bacteroidia bacterium]|nr:GLPGLI family protein [Bacteroidia bacterium]